MHVHAFLFEARMLVGRFIWTVIVGNSTILILPIGSSIIKYSNKYSPQSRINENNHINSGMLIIKVTIRRLDCYTGALYLA